jgi:hypothetical protein
LILFKGTALSNSGILSVVKTRPALHVPLLYLRWFFALIVTASAGTFTAKVFDLDAGNGYLTVTSPANQTTQTFKITSGTVILNANGKPGQLLSLIEGTPAAGDVEPGNGKLAGKIAVLPNFSEEPP